MDYKQFYEQVGKTNGWDFSKVKCVSEGVQRDLYREVSEACNPSGVLLDIGTGGGEAIVSIADAALLLIGIDQSAGMIETATTNAAKSGLSNIRFLKMEAERLEFPDHFFDIVSCRHSEFYAHEVARVLQPGGVFLTQQVSENDKSNLKEAFGRGQAMGVEAGTLKKRYIEELSQAGFTDIQSFESRVTEYYQEAEDLIFLLTHTPIIPGFGQTENDFRILQQFIEDNRSPKGIRTSAERFIITAAL